MRQSVVPPAINYLRSLQYTAPVSFESG